MKFRIQKVTVLGSGIMGSGIACHLANIGIEVLMLDIPPKNDNDNETVESDPADEVQVQNDDSQNDENTETNEIPNEDTPSNEDMINELLNEDLNDDMGLDIDGDIDIDNI